jgi:hypothetical protein
VAERKKLMSGIVDVLVGIVPLVPVVVSGMNELSIPYIFGAVKWFVHCPKPISRVEKFLTWFDVSVWLTIITAIILTSALFWILFNYPDQMVHIDSKTLQKYINIFTMRGIFLLV